MTSTGFYLLDHKLARDQYRRQRREDPSGVIVLHSAENVPDLNPPDTGAEAVARFIVGRPDAGSYHDLVDSDSTVPLVPWDAEAYHDGTGTNRHSIGLSAAWQAHQLPGLIRDHPAWVHRAVVRMAHRAAEAALWLRHEHGVTVPARRISAAEARARVPGFVTHAELDPARRSDPGDAFLWSLFLGTFARLTDAGTRPDPPEGDDMLTLDQIGLKVIESVRWCLDKDEVTRDAVLGMVGLKVIEAVRWCASKDDVTREALKGLIRDVLDERA